MVRLVNGLINGQRRTNQKIAGSNTAMVEKPSIKYRYNALQDDNSGLTQAFVTLKL